MSASGSAVTPIAAPEPTVANRRHFVPLLSLTLICLAYWSKVLFTQQVLLPGAMLRGFAPFGSDVQAPWNILQWDALGQYYPWRMLAARELQAGQIPLWNPYQFSGAPFLANAQSAVFYPLNLPFWFLDVAFAFGVVAFCHTLLASFSTYFLAQRWQLSQAASLVASIAFGLCGYLSAWAMLPTLANTASWLPLLILCLEYAAQKTGHDTEVHRSPLVASLPLALILTCALLAGHAQVFFYLLLALLLRALLLPNRGRALLTLLLAFAGCLALSAAQLLPTLELARLGHRAAQGAASAGGWQFVSERALQSGSLPSLLIPDWPSLSFNENFGYVGFGVFLLALLAFINAFSKRTRQETLWRLAAPVTYSSVLLFFGLLYAMATPLAQLFYFTVPGLSQMGGVGRALLLWNFGAALLAAHGVDALRSKWNSNIVAAIALLVVTGEMFAAGWALHPTAHRNTIYPETEMTQWLKEHTRDGSRVLFVTPRGSWLPVEAFQMSQAYRSHPPGVLPPNGAIVYGLYDVNGYDSLAPRAYREFVTQGEGTDVSPQLNGNMVLLNNPNSPALNALNVRYIVSIEPLDDPKVRQVLQTDNCYVYQRSIQPTKRLSGSDFYPGWRGGQYQPESFRFGTFISLCTLALMSAVWLQHLLSGRDSNDNSDDDYRGAA